MNSTAKVGAAVAGGYVLGRFKKARLALTLGAWMARRKLEPDLRRLMEGGLAQLAHSPELTKLSGEVRQELSAAVRSAATMAVTNRTEHIADALHSRTNSLQERLTPAENIPSPGRRSKSTSDSDAEEPADEGEDTQGTEDAPRTRRSRPRASSTRRSATASAKPATRRRTTKAASGAARKSARKATSSR